MNGVIVRDLEAGGKMPSSFNGYQKLHKGNLLMCLFDYDVTPRTIGLIQNEGVTSPAYSQFKMLNGNCSNYYYYYYLMIDNTKELLNLAKNLRHSFTEEQLLTWYDKCFLMMLHAIRTVEIRKIKKERKDILNNN